MLCGRGTNALVTRSPSRAPETIDGRGASHRGRARGRDIIGCAPALATVGASIHLEVLARDAASSSRPRWMARAHVSAMTARHVAHPKSAIVARDHESESDGRDGRLQPRTRSELGRLAERSERTWTGLAPTT